MTPDAHHPTRSTSPTTPPGGEDFTRDVPPDAGSSTKLAFGTTSLMAIRAVEGLKAELAAPPLSANAAALDTPPGFVVEKELGTGGMGVVYLARQVGLNRQVALKLMKAGERVDAKAIIRFLAEAEAVATVRHPNVVEVYQYGDHLGRPYLALEYCPGGDLTRWTTLAHTPNAKWYRWLAELMAGVAAGVAAAHEQGIVHRDLKPHNVLLTADGTPKVADFGLAKRGLGSDLTRTGAVMGTPAYMSPEQAGGAKFVGPEADVWSLGVMLYELACGRRPIDTDGPLLMAVKLLADGEVPPLQEKVPGIPRDLALIIHKCLMKNPKDRYPTAGGVAADLWAWSAGMPISARPVGVVESTVKRVRRNPVVSTSVVVTVLAVMLAVWAVYTVLQTSEPRLKNSINDTMIGAQDGKKSGDFKK